MAVILNIETSTPVCSVALSKDGAVIFNQQDNEGPSHTEKLGVFIQEALDFAEKNELKLDAVAVSCGPGSYTGLRIGVSTAKGLCYGLNIPLIAVPTLKVMACALLFDPATDEEALLCPMIDARRMEVFATIYDRALQEVKPTSADIIDENSYLEYLEKQKVIFFGNGADKCSSTITHTNAAFISGISPLAGNMMALAEMDFRQENFVDVAYFEPFYLKEFVATTPKNKVF